MQLVSQLVAIENLHADDLPIHDVNIQVAFFAVERDSFVAGTPSATRFWRGVKRGAEIIAASATVNDAKRCDLRDQVMLRILFELRSQLLREFGQDILEQRLVHDVKSNPTLAFSCGARSAFKLNEGSYLRSMLSRRQLQGFVIPA